MTTRKARAAELLARLQRGPSFPSFANGNGGVNGNLLTPQQATDAYRLWASTWICPELVELCPELAGVDPGPIASAGRTLTPRLIGVASGGVAVTCDQALGTFATREEINDTLRNLTTFATGSAPNRVTAHDRSRAAEAFRQLDFAAGHNADDLPAKYAAAATLVAELEKK